MALFNKGGKPSFQVLLENLQVLVESDIFLLVGQYSVLGNFLGGKTFSKIVALIVKEGRIWLEVDKLILLLSKSK